MNQIKTLLIAALSVCTFSVSAQWIEVEWAETDGLTMIDFVNDEVGYAFMQELQGFNTGLGKTEDGGQTWAEIELPDPGYQVLTLDFFNEGEGVIVFRDWESTDAVTQIYQTINDGETWENISPSTTVTGFGIADVQFFDATTGFFVTGDNLYATVDGGDSWTETILPTAAISLSFMDVDHGIIGTWDGSFNYFGGMLSTSDGGQTWNQTVLDVQQSVVGVVHQFNETTAYAAPVKWGGNGQQQFHKTTDNGLNWTAIPVPETSDNAKITGFYFRDENYGVITMSANEEFYIYETTDAGEAWELQNQLGQFYIGDLTLTENSGYIVGGLGKIYRLDALLAVNNYDNTTVSLYPNPASSGQIIRWESAVDFSRISIVDVTGKIVHQGTINGQNAKLPNLNRGVYFIALQSELNSNVVKILID